MLWADPPPIAAPANIVPLQAMAKGDVGQPAKPITDDDPLPTAGGPVAWSAAAQTTIAADSTYQALFAAGQARHGGYVVNMSPPGSAPVWVDVTGATGASPATSAVPVYPAMTTGGAPGVWRFPGTTHAVTIAGPAGSTVNAIGG